MALKTAAVARVRERRIEAPRVEKCSS